jgi:adenine deaminase
MAIHQVKVKIGVLQLLKLLEVQLKDPYCFFIFLTLIVNPELRFQGL